MKLQEKRTVNAELATQKKRQIDDGLALAGKVDAMRETKLKEERNLEVWRNETLARTQIEIDDKIKERERIASDIEFRKRELIELRKPLDNEWKEVGRERDKFLKEIESLSRDRVILGGGIALNLQRERDNENESQRIAEEKRRSEEDLAQTKALKEDSVKELLDARGKAKVIILEAESREKAVSIRENQIEERESFVESEKKRLDEISKQQRAKEKEIRDKYQTLQRTIKRLNN